MTVGKPVDIYVEETTGTTSEAQLTDTFRVNGEDIDGHVYTIPQGYKLKIFEVEVIAEGETRTYIKTHEAATLAYASSVRRKKYKLASAGHLHIRYSFPLIIEAITNNVGVYLSTIQTSAVAMAMQLHGELKKLEE